MRTCRFYVASQSTIGSELPADYPYTRSGPFNMCGNPAVTTGAAAWRPLGMCEYGGGNGCPSYVAEDYRVHRHEQGTDEHGRAGQLLWRSARYGATAHVTHELVWINHLGDVEVMRAASTQDYTDPANVMAALYDTTRQGLVDNNYKLTSVPTEEKRPIDPTYIAMVTT